MFSVGDMVRILSWDDYGIITEHCPYEFDDNDLDSEMEDEYVIFMIHDGNTYLFSARHLKKVN
jgi:hypothetical protein